MTHSLRFQACFTVALAAALFASLGACSGKTLDVGTASQDQSDDAGDGSVPQVDASCTKLLPARTGAASSIVGTWLLESFDEVNSGTSSGQARHYPIDRNRPILAVTFNSDGTWTRSSCNGDDKYGACSAFCDGHLSCAAGTYTYEGGLLDSKVANYGKQPVEMTADGLSILGFFGTLGYSNLVKIDALPPCY